MSSFLPSLGVYDSDHKLGAYINIQKPGSLMKLNDNTTELYYRISFGECSGAESRSMGFLETYSRFDSLARPFGTAMANSKSSDLPAFSKTYSSMRIGSATRLILIDGHTCFLTSSLGTIEPQAKIERGSLRWLNKAGLEAIATLLPIGTRTGIRCCRYISDALNNYLLIAQLDRARSFYLQGCGFESCSASHYPTTNVLNLLLVIGAWVFCVWNRFLGLFAVKNILTLDKTIKRTQILSNGSPFHLRPMVT